MGEAGAGFAGPGRGAEGDRGMSTTGERRDWVNRLIDRAYATLSR